MLEQWSGQLSSKALVRRVSLLDDALLRPGRFDRLIYMGRPSAANRLRILQVHAKDKPIDRSNDDAVLSKVPPHTSPPVKAGCKGLQLCIGWRGVT